MVDLKEKMKANPKQKRKTKKTFGAGGAAGAAAVEVNGEAATNGQKATEQEPSGEDEDDEVSSTNSGAAPGNREGANGLEKLFSFSENL